MAKNFDTTRWSLVFQARSSNDIVARNALEIICESYWKPLYAWLRANGHDPSTSEDLLQGFFLHVFQKNLFEKAESENGRLRNFLLKSLKSYVLNDIRKGNAKKRGGEYQSIPLEFVDSEAAEAEISSGLNKHSHDPSLLFDKRWARTILRRAMRNLKSEYVGQNKGHIFEILRPFLSEIEPGTSYAKAAIALNCEEGTVRVYFHRLKKDYRNEVKIEVARTITNDEDLEEEMQYLQKLLS